jgi:hypothetical protein
MTHEEIGHREAHGAVAISCRTNERFEIASSLPLLAMTTTAGLPPACRYA